MLRVGKRQDSIILTEGQSSEIGRYEVLMLLGFPGLSRGMIVDVFQMSGVVHVERDRLKMAVR